MFVLRKEKTATLKDSLLAKAAWCLQLGLGLGIGPGNGIISTYTLNGTAKYRCGSQTKTSLTAHLLLPWFAVTALSQSSILAKHELENSFLFSKRGWNSTHIHILLDEL